MPRAVLVIALSAAFGGADQYLGSLHAHPWAHEASLLSAPWLLVAFLAGWTQPKPKPAALLGLVATFAALVGYWLMTLSPIEGAHLTVRGVHGLVVSQSPVIVGGLLTGPLFGWLGNRWRNERVWLGALAAAAAACLEPLAHAAVGDAVTFRAVWAVEVGVGVAMLIYVVSETLARSRTRRDTT